MWSWPISATLLFDSMIAALPAKVSEMTSFRIPMSKPTSPTAAPRATVFIIMGVPPTSSTMPFRGTG